jgi:hypothetical protein
MFARISICAEGQEDHSDPAVNPEPAELLMRLSFRDVHLSYFADKQAQISRLISGDPLLVNEKGFFNTRGEQIARYSQSFLDRIAPLAGTYRAEDASVFQMVYWCNNGTDREICIVLPEVWMRKG